MKEVSIEHMETWLLHDIHGGAEKSFGQETLLNSGGGAELRDLSRLITRLQVSMYLLPLVLLIAPPRQLETVKWGDKHLLGLLKKEDGKTMTDRLGWAERGNPWLHLTWSSRRPGRRRTLPLWYWYAIICTKSLYKTCIFRCVCVDLGILAMMWSLNWTIDHLIRFYFCQLFLY